MRSRMSPAAPPWKADGLPQASWPAILAALRLLLEAAQFAGSKGADPWVFAVELNCLLTGGSTASALRWLTQEELIQCKLETTRANGKSRRFQRSRSLTFGPHCCFVLTEQGLKVARMAGPSEEEELAWSQATLANDNGAACKRTGKPRFDVENRQLFADGHLLHVYSAQACNRVRILTALQEEDWPTWPNGVDDPLPGNMDGNPVQRLRDALSGINHDQKLQLFKLRTIRKGTAVAWQWLAAPQRRNAK